MNGFTQTKIQIKKLTWLTLGFCFVLLYSCPVKKYLLLTYGGARANESATCQFQKDVNGHSDRIAYLRRPCLKSIGGMITAALSPATPPAFQFFSISFFASRDSRGAIGRAISARHDAIAGAPPRYLEQRRFLI